MPHQCTTCDRTFPDGSKAMLGGCPDCGGNKFQFLPSGGIDRPAADDAAPSNDPGMADGPGTADEPGTADDAPAPPGDGVGEPPAAPTPESPPTSGSSEASTTTSDPGSSPAGAGAAAPTPDDDGIVEAPSEPPSEGPPREEAEDAAQASARRSVVSPDELPGVDDKAAILEEIARDSRSADEAAGSTTNRDRPDLATLRKELNDQFESIKILEPGQYELNLMELYDREEYIIALEEDGRYVIDVPTRWRDDEPDD